MPIYDEKQATENGYAQVRKAMTSFAGNVVKVEEGAWAPKKDEATGILKKAKEYLEIFCENVQVMASTEPLTMDITEWNFRADQATDKKSFWVQKFLPSARVAGVILPNGLVGKRILFSKVTLEAKDKNGIPNPKYNKTSFVIEKVLGDAMVKPADLTAPETTPNVPKVDPMIEAVNLANGKTEIQFRSAIGLNPLCSSLIPLAKTGALTAQLVAEGRLTKINNAGREVYQKVS